MKKLMKKANPVWQVILGLSRYPVFLNHRTHGNESSRRYVIFPCIRVCSVVLLADNGCVLPEDRLANPWPHK